MKIIGLTGPTGSGKSSLTPLAEELGFKVIDCDRAARQATEKGTDGLAALVSAFGEDILLPDGSLNRRVLAEKAFCSPKQTSLLNETILPHITALIEGQLDRELILLDAPTLIESGLNKKCTAVIGVLADKKIRLERIMSRDGLDTKAAELRLNAGKGDGFYSEACDYIIYNSSDFKVCENDFKKILTAVKENQ